MVSSLLKLVVIRPLFSEIANGLEVFQGVDAVSVEAPDAVAFHIDDVITFDTAGRFVV